MKTKTEILRENLKIDPSVWTEAYTHEDGADFHFVVRRQYDKAILKNVEGAFAANVACWVGFHAFRVFNPNPRLTINVNLVLTDPTNGQTKSGVSVFKKWTNPPVDIEPSNLYWADYQTMTVLNAKGLEVTSSFLDAIYEIHVKPAKLFRGIFFRVRYWMSREFLSGFFRVFMWSSRTLLRLISGEKFVAKTAEDIHYTKSLTQQVDIEKVSGDVTAEFLGAKVNVYSAASYALVHLVIAVTTILLNISNKLVERLADNLFITTAYVVFTLYLWDRAIPKFLKGATLFFAKKATNAANRNVKV